MDLPKTYVTSESLNIYHNMVVPNTCIHIDISEVVGIVTLLCSPTAHIYCVWGSPYT